MAQITVPQQIQGCHKTFLRYIRFCEHFVKHSFDQYSSFNLCYISVLNSINKKDYRTAQKQVNSQIAQLQAQQDNLPSNKNNSRLANSLSAGIKICQLMNDLLKGYATRIERANNNTVDAEVRSANKIFSLRKWITREKQQPFVQFGIALMLLLLDVFLFLIQDDMNEYKQYLLISGAVMATILIADIVNRIRIRSFTPFSFNLSTKRLLVVWLPIMIGLLVFLIMPYYPHQSVRIITTILTAAAVCWMPSALIITFATLLQRFTKKKYETNQQVIEQSIKSVEYIQESYSAESDNMSNYKVGRPRRDSLILDIVNLIASIVTILGWLGIG